MKRFAVVALALFACEQAGTIPVPSISALSLSGSSGPLPTLCNQEGHDASDHWAVRVEGIGFFALPADAYSSSAGLVKPEVTLFGPETWVVSPEQVGVTSDTQLEIQLPTAKSGHALAPGSYDLEVQNPYGVAARLPGAVRVRLPGQVNSLSWIAPDGDRIPTVCVSGWPPHTFRLQGIRLGDAGAVMTLPNASSPVVISGTETQLIISVRALPLGQSLPGASALTLYPAGGCPIDAGVIRFNSCTFILAQVIGSSFIIPVSQDTRMSFLLSDPAGGLTGRIAASVMGTLGAGGLPDVPLRDVQVHGGTGVTPPYQVIVDATVPACSGFGPATSDCSNGFKPGYYDLLFEMDHAMASASIQFR